METTVRFELAVAGRADVRGRRVSFYGVSVCATLSLLAAESPALTGRVRAVGGEAPWVELKKVIRLATTRVLRPNALSDRPVRAARDCPLIAAGLPPGRDRARLLSVLEAVADDDPHPLSPLRTIRLRPAGRALVSLLLNTGTSRFAPLYVRLRAALRRGVRLLSPLVRARRLGVPVELASAPHDRYFRRPRHARSQIAPSTYASP
jgi:hypothetical protein